MAVVLFLLSCLSLLIWCVLLFARGGFWRARPAAPLDARAARNMAGGGRRGAGPQ